MSMPHKCRCAICGGEMGWIGMPSVTQMLPCACAGTNCCLDNLPPNTGMALGSSYCRKARGELLFTAEVKA